MRIRPRERRTAKIFGVDSSSSDEEVPVPRQAARKAPSLVASKTQAKKTPTSQQRRQRSVSSSDSDDPKHVGSRAVSAKKRLRIEAHDAAEDLRSSHRGGAAFDVSTSSDTAAAVTTKNNGKKSGRSSNPNEKPTKEVAEEQVAPSVHLKDPPPTSKDDTLSSQSNDCVGEQSVAQPLVADDATTVSVPKRRGKQKKGTIASDTADCEPAVSLHIAAAADEEKSTTEVSAGCGGVLHDSQPSQVTLPQQITSFAPRVEFTKKKMTTMIPPSVSHFSLTYVESVGIPFQLSSGVFGVCFKDGSCILLDHDGKSSRLIYINKYHHRFAIKTSPTGLVAVPRRLERKVFCVIWCRQYLHSEKGCILSNNQMDGKFGRCHFHTTTTKAAVGNLGANTDLSTENLTEAKGELWDHLVDIQDERPAYMRSFTVTPEASEAATGGNSKGNGTMSCVLILSNRSEPYPEDTYYPSDEEPPTPSAVHK